MKKTTKTITFTQLYRMLGNIGGTVQSIEHDLKSVKRQLGDAQKVITAMTLQIQDSGYLSALPKRKP